ncbi:MAG: patatin-like phospholipase RssA [Alphaproteobacteria bacterium]|nr:MAG: patatin-like phospholipase RssA [Alphaproteobacteria bacterium]
MTNDQTDLPRPKIGLALGSGVARGWAHLGVLKALERYGFRPDIVAGTSIGALVGGAYLAGHADTLEQWARSLTMVRMLSYLDFRVRSGGMIGGSRLVDAMVEHMGRIDIEDLPAPYAAVATDLVSGHEVWLREGDLATAIRTSFSMPGIFEPMRVNGRWMVDGALVNPVPISVCIAMGAQMTIAVNLNADLLGKGRRNAPDLSALGTLDPLSAEEAGSNGGGRARLTTLARRMLRRTQETPSLFGVMVSALNIVQDRISRSRLAGDPPDIHITPRLGDVGLLEFHRADEIIEEGEAAVERVLPELRAAMAVFGRDLDSMGEGA